MRPTLIIAAGFAVLPILTAPALAQANRTFVSGFGSDSNPCSLAAPCRSFAGALSQTNAGGEITVLDSAGYGTLFINKSITITNPGGVEAGITATAGQTAITINAAGGIPTIITLRGLTLEGGGVGSTGISGNANGTVNIIGCVVKDFVNDGIVFDSGNTNPSNPPVVGNITIADTFSLNNGTGISLLGVAQASIGHTTTAGNAGGIFLFNTNATLVEDYINNNTGNGILMQGGSGLIFIKHSTAMFNGTNGIYDDLDASGTTSRIFVTDHSLINIVRGTGPGQINTDGTNSIQTTGALTTGRTD